MIPLGLLGPGELGEITEIRTGKGRCTGPCCTGHKHDDIPATPKTAAKLAEHQCCKDKEKSEVRVGDMGLRIGKKVEILNNGGGPVLVKVDESRIAVARGIAMKIMVRRLQ
jgi:ferrous iron transport protein A